MNTGIGLLAIVLLGIVVLIALGSGNNGRSHNDYEEEIRTLKEIIARDVERERSGDGPSGGDIIAAVIVVIVLATIIFLVMGGSSNALMR
jgi:hypothetical protein